MALDFTELERRLVVELARVQAATSAELRAQLGISQPTFSRLLNRARDKILVVGRAGATRYAARRAAQDLAESVPVYEIDDVGRPRHHATLHAVLPEGYYVESFHTDIDAAFYRDLPYFLQDLRPAGFLGRLVPQQHPELGLPADARLWTANDVLRYISRFGWNLPGSFVVGDEALSLFLELGTAASEVVETRDRRQRYPVLARDVLRAGLPGSSAGGEQPKFLATRSPGHQVLVKFSSLGQGARSRREADLLIAEHAAHQVLERHGQSASRSELVVAGEQVFLEVERFDRLPGGGRSGVISLLSLDAEFLGSMKSWTDSVVRLARLGHLPQDVVEATQLRELFGHLIGNTDMHPGNISFYARGSRALGLAPVYDMLPMLYAASTAADATPELVLKPPAPRDTKVWRVASEAAHELWQVVAKDPRVSRAFAAVARGNAARVESWRKLASRLP